MAHPLRPYDDPGDASNAIPMFSKNGTALSEIERERIAEKRGQCLRCGVKTKDVKFLKQKSLTSEQVFKGVCIRCNPDRVPQEIYRAWEEKFKPAASKLSPVGKFRAAARATAFAMSHSPPRQQQQQPRPTTDPKSIDTVKFTSGCWWIETSSARNIASRDIIRPRSL